MIDCKRALCAVLSAAMLLGLGGCSPRAGRDVESSLDRLLDSWMPPPEVEAESYLEGEDIFEDAAGIIPLELEEDRFTLYSRVSHQVLIQQDLPYKAVQGEEGAEYLLSDMCGPADLWREGASYPFVLFVHGGSWSNGDKNSARTEIITLAHHGYVAVSLDYRKLPDWGVDQMVEDVLDAFKFYYDRADEFGIDTDNMYLVGTSSGGHIALLSAYSMGEGYAAAMNTRGYAFDIKGVCAYAAPVSASEELLLAQLTKVYGDDAAAVCDTLLGATAGENPQRIQRADILTLITEEAPATLIMQGELDEVVDRDDPQLLYENLMAHGVHAELTIYADLGHEFDQAALLGRVDEFVRSRL